MSVNRVSVALSIAEQQEVMSIINTLRQKLSFLTQLSPEERYSIPSLSDRDRILVQKVLKVAAQNPDVLPPSFDLEEMQQDLELFEALQPVGLALNHLQKLVDDTALTVGGEIYESILEIYEYLQANNVVTELRSLISELEQPFKE